MRARSWLMQMLTVCLLAACAVPGGPLKLEVENVDLGRVWPAAPTGEPPRYRLVGQLIGAENFANGLNGFLGGVTRAAKWIVGLDGKAEREDTLRRPQGVASDATGRIFVTDVAMQAVVVFDTQGRRIERWFRAGPDLNFIAPVGVAPGNNGEIFVADSGLKRVVRLDARGEPISAWGSEILKWPTGVAFDPASAEVFVADTHAHDIKVFTVDGKLLSVIGTAGPGEGEFSYPTYLAVREGRIYVTDTLNARVQVLERDGRFVRQFGQRGLYVGNLVHPKGIAVDDEGHVYVVESMHDYLLVFNDDGRFMMALGGTGKRGGEFYLPAGVWVDRSNRVWVADTFNGRVVAFQYLGGDP